MEAVNLSKSFGSFAALSDLNLRLEGKKCVGFLGPNGAGKTTTMKVFTGLLRASRGRALVNGVDVGKDKKGALASCTSLIETPEIYPSLTAREALRMLCELRGVSAAERNKRIDDVLAMVKMQEWAEKKVGSFSKGMKQRVNVASTLLSDPEVLILDEPTTGMDPRGMSEVRGIVKSLSDRLVFMSSHLLPEVTEVCQEVAVIDHGKLVLYDKIGNVTARFSGSGGVVEVGFAHEVGEAEAKKVAGLPGVLSATRSNDRQLIMKFAVSQGAQERLFEEIAGLRLGVISFRESTTGLEEAYLNLVGETV